MAIKLTVTANNGRCVDVERALKDYFFEKLEDRQTFYYTEKGADSVDANITMKKSIGSKYEIKILGLSHPLIAARYKEDIEGIPGVLKASAEIL